MIVRCCLGVLLSTALLAQRDAVVELPDEVVFGAAFDVVVVAAADYDADRLRPLVVEEVARAPAHPGQRIVYRARCYEVDSVTVAGHTLRVRSSLPEPVGALEWPAATFALAAPADGGRWWWWLAALLAPLGIVCWRRSRSAAAADQPDLGGPRWQALAALEHLPPPVDGAVEPFCRELKAIVRRHCEEHLGLPAVARTSEELLAAWPGRHEHLRACLSACDVVLFGRAPASPGELQRVREHAIAFVRTPESGS